MTENEFRAIVRANIRRFRDYKKWTQAELAEKMDISVNFLSDIENGRRWISPSSMVKFAAVLNIEPYELFKPADLQPPGITGLFNKYNDDVQLAVSNSLNQVYNYYQNLVGTETKAKSTAPKHVKRR
jgi:transcriptional regulator with XRE-family HTH domain